MINVGEILYTNVHPFFYHLNRDQLQHDVSFVPSIPAKLNEAMAQGNIDVGAISSFAYAQNHEDYVLMPDLAVAAKGEVGSIFLFSKVPIEQLNDKSIALTHSSATSIHLLKVIMRRFYEHRRNTYHTVPPIYDEMMLNHDACLLIGDDAIEAKRREEHQVYVYDLANLWTSNTSLPMTFAVFAMRKDKLAEEPEGMKQLLQEWKSSEAKTRRNGYEELAAHVSKEYGGPPSFWTQYFTNLRYQFQEEDQKGLLHFYTLLYEEGYLHDKADELKVWDVGVGIHSIT
ncbi:menaquinone biosynthesis protein [Geomicrobium sp. JSM 1781026]|uniref:menaquinone biosynthesis protein n=1 Tax=Geomicrobium sp. JSM 1781026 TaxID=3344580 RepID=UPI0035C06397